MSDSESKGLQRDEFEDQLRLSLRHIEVPKGFAAHVLERAGMSEKKFRRGPRWRWIGAVAAAVALVALVGNQVRVWRERASVAAIQTQFDTAMRVTSHALEQTRVELEHVGVRFDE